MVGELGLRPTLRHADKVRRDEIDGKVLDRTGSDEEQKNHGANGAVVLGVLCGYRAKLDLRLAQGLDALGAPHLLNQAAILQEGHLLQIRLPIPIGGALGKRAIMPESCGLAAIGTLGHRT
jgi:hypothetical protein